MRRFLALTICAVSLGAAAQSSITYPYNPDGNADAIIGATDLQDLLANYGGAFSPSEILVGDSTLTFWIHQLSETVNTQQALIDSLMGSGVNQTNPCEGLNSVTYHGVEYSIVAIGDQCWFAEELQTDKYNNGDPIVASNSMQTNTNGDTCIVAFEPIVLVDTFSFSPNVPVGYYSYGVVQSDLNVCPQGWHIPVWSDVLDLGLHLGPSKAGHELKDAVFWDGEDLHGFHALPTGLLERESLDSQAYEECFEATNALLDNSDFLEIDWASQFMVCEGAACDSINDALLLSIDNFNASLPDSMPQLASYPFSTSNNYDWEYQEIYENWLNQDVQWWPEHACYGTPFEELVDWLQIEISYSWIDQGKYAEWWIDQGRLESCYVEDAFMAVWGRRMNLIPLQFGDGLGHYPGINSPIRCIKDAE